MTAPVRTRLATAIALLAIVALGGWLRFDRIRETSPFLWDDAIHHLEAVWLRDTLHFARTSIDRKLAEARGGGDLWTWEGERKRFAAEVGGLAPRFGRPGHMVLVTAAMAVVGPVPWAGPLVSAIAGTLSIAVLFGLVRAARRDARDADAIALVAAAWLALDPLSVRLSREGLADADGMLAALVAFAAYVRARRPGASGGWCWAAGFLAGLAFTVQTRNFLVVAALVAWELAPGALAAGRRLTERARRAAAIATFAALPLVLAEAPYYLAFLVGRSHGIAPALRGYALQVVGIFANHHYAKAHYVHASALANLASYPSLFHALAGTWLPQLVVAVGLAQALTRAVRGSPREARASAQLACSWLLGSFAFLSVSAPLARYASFFVPAMSWLAAEGTVAAWCLARARDAAEGDRRHGHTPGARLSFRVLAGVWLAAAALAAGVLGRASLREAEIAAPGYRDAVNWMRDHGTARHVSTSPFVSQVWAGVGEAELVPSGADELAALVASGHRFLLVDLIRNFFLGPFAPRGALVGEIARRCAPAATFPNDWAKRSEYLFEFNYDVRETWRRIAAAPGDRTGVIDVFDLAACTATAPDTQAPRSSEP
ncbi:MAG: glycosyltransferase family 39 protein [bacterium]